MATRLYEDDQYRRLDQHPCAFRDLNFWRLLRYRVLRSAGAILGPGRDRPSSRLDVVRDVTRATLEANVFQTHAVIESMKLDSKSELAHLKVDGGMTNGDLAMEVTRGRGRVRGGAARDAREHRARVCASRCVCRWRVRVGYHAARDARGRQYGAQHGVCASYDGGEAPVGRGVVCSALWSALVGG